MADSSDVGFEDLERESRALEVLTEEFGRTRDPDKIKELTALTQAQASRVQEIAQRIADQHQRAHGVDPDADETSATDPLRGCVEVRLTPTQAMRVEALTGEGVESVVVPDPTGVVARTMASTSPAQVELWAVRDVIARRRVADAEADARRMNEGMARRIALLNEGLVDDAEVNDG